MVVEAGLARLRMANDDRCKHLSLPPDYRRPAAAWACLPESALFSSHLSDRLCVQTFIKFDIFGSFLGLAAQRGRARGFFFIEKGILVSGTKGPLASGTKENPGP